MSEKKRLGRYLLIYTVLFSVLFLLVFSPFLLGGKNLIGKGDGQSQYILQLRYMGEWLRSTVKGFAGGSFHPARFDFTIGMGDDIGAVVRFHPLDFLSVLVPVGGTETLYCLLTVFRCYLAGLSLSAYVLFFRRSQTAALTGALFYVFCGYTFGLGIVHPTYLSPMILLPLILLGAERMMDPKRGGSFLPFSIFIALGFISNYYFMYISSFGLLAYVLIRFFALYKKDRRRNFFRLLISMSLAYLLGLALSGVFLLPALARYGTSLRAAHQADRNSLLIYADKRRYLAWFLNLITPLEASGNGTHLNFAVTLLPAVSLLLSSKEKRETYRQIKAALGLLLVCLLLPAAGYVLAAMNNENNRWVYLIACAAAIAVSFTADQVLRLRREDRRLLLLLTAAFDLGSLGWFLLTREAFYHLTAAGELTLYTALLLILSRKSREAEACGSGAGSEEGRLEAKSGERNPAAVRSERVVLACTAASAALAGWLTFTPRFGNLIRYYQDRGSAFSRFDQSSYAAYKKVPLYTGERGDGVWKKGFYRVDGVRESSWEDNSSLALKYPGIQIYNSIVNADQLRAMIDQESIGLTSILHIQSLDGRTVLEELAGVRYFAADEANSASVPFGYADAPLTRKRRLALYENQNPLPFGFAADTVISREDYEKLSPAARDLVMLRAAVVEDVPQGLHATDGGEEEAEVLRSDVDLEGTDGVMQEGTTLSTGKEEGVLSATCRRRAGYECYLHLEGLRLQGGRSLSAYATVKADGIQKRILLSAGNSAYTRTADDYIVNLGGAKEDGTMTVQLLLPDQVQVALDKAAFLYLPMKDYAEKVAMLSRESLTDVTLKGDTVTGRVNLDSPRYMIFQIPYSKGWTVRVNGEKAALDRADLCYLGLSLPAGSSRIVLTYRTPGLTAGLILTGLGIMTLLAEAAVQVARRRKEGRLGRQ